jgi:hypothetical protein
LAPTQAASGKSHPGPDGRRFFVKLWQ